MVIDCNRITEATKDLMFKLMKDSFLDSKERYISLCQNKNKDIISSDVCIGDKCVVYAKDIEKTLCPNNTKQIGHFHTHTKSNEPSLNDIHAVAQEEFKSFCIGFTNTNKIECYNIKNKKILRLSSRIQDLLKKGDIKEAQITSNTMGEELLYLMRGLGPMWREVLETNCTINKNINHR